MNFRPADVAKECEVSVNTIRKWCQDYGEFLTPGAKVEDAPRVLTERDMEVLKYVSELRKEKLQKPQIVLRLRETSFGTIEPEPAPLQPSRAIQESPTGALVSVSTMEAIARGIVEQVRAELQAEIEPLKVERRRIDVVFIAVTAFVAGFMLGLAVWWFQ